MEIGENEINDNCLTKETIKNSNDSYQIENNIDGKCISGLNPHFLYQSNAFNENPNKVKSNMKTSNLDNNILYNENFIKQMRFIPNNKELVLINNKNQILLSRIDMDRIVSISKDKDIIDNKYSNEEADVVHSNSIFEENNHIYDIEILYDKNSFTYEDYLKNIIICSKENPIRILNGKTRNDILKTYIIRNQVEEIINPVCLKIDQTELSLFAGGNKFIAKIDLVEDKIEKFQLKNEKNSYEKSVYSCFAFNSNSQFYLTGTYSKKIFLVDNRTNTPFDTLVYHLNGVNSLRILQNEINFISGARKDDNVHVWDLRNLKIPTASFWRNGDCNQKLDIELDKEEKHIFLANKDGTCSVYDLANLNNQASLCYFYENGFGEPVSSLTYNREYDLLATSNGTRHFPNIIDNEIESSNKLRTENEMHDCVEDKMNDYIDDPYVPSYFKLWKFTNF